MSPWTVRCWQGCLIIETPGNTWRIPTGQIFAVRQAQAWESGDVWYNSLVIELPERHVTLWEATVDEINRLTNAIFDAIAPGWSLGPEDKPEPGTVTSIHRSDQ